MGLAGGLLIIGGIIGVGALLSRPLVAAAGRARPRAAAEPAFDYQATPLLVNASERAAWQLLTQLPLGVHAVCPKVRLEDFAKAGGRGSPQEQRLRNHSKSRHVDFLLVDADWRPVLAVEVDGRGHADPATRQSDAVKDRVLAAARVPVLRLAVGTDWRSQLLAWAADRRQSGSCGMPRAQAVAVNPFAAAVPRPTLGGRLALSRRH